METSQMMQKLKWGFNNILSILLVVCSLSACNKQENNDAFNKDKYLRNIMDTTLIRVIKEFQLADSNTEKPKIIFVKIKEMDSNSYNSGRHLIFYLRSDNWYYKGTEYNYSPTFYSKIDEDYVFLYSSSDRFIEEDSVYEKHIAKLVSSTIKSIDPDYPITHTTISCRVEICDGKVISTERSNLFRPDILPPCYEK